MSERLITYVDFDFTLYDTGSFASDLFNLIADHARIRPLEAESDSLEHYAHPVLGGYDFDAHIGRYGLNSTIMWGELQDLTSLNNYLFPDSAQFIQEARRQGYDPKILSFGERRFQLAKISPTLQTLAGKGGVKPEVIVVDKKKHEHIRSLHPGQQGVLIDDVPNQELPAGFTEIHLNRSLSLVKPLATEGGFTISALHQALDVLRQLSAAML